MVYKSISGASSVSSVNSEDFDTGEGRSQLLWALSLTRALDGVAAVFARGREGE